MAHKDWYHGALGLGIDADTCADPMSRADLLALRAASQLSVQCHYIIDDHAQGNVPAGTVLLLHATSPNTLAIGVHVLTPLDNSAWWGLYDIDLGVLIELTDNLGNTARGLLGAEVANFDWGNTAYFGCLVDHATWFQQLGNPTPMQRVQVTGGSQLNTIGIASAAGLVNVRISGQSSVNLGNSNWQMQNVDISGRSFWIGSSYTGGGVQQESRISGLAVVSAFNASGTLTLREVELSDGAFVTHSNAIAGLQLVQTKLTSRSGISHGPTGGITDIAGSQLSGAATMSITANRSVTVAQVSMDGGSIESSGNNGVASLTVRLSSTQGGFIRCRSNVTMDVEDCQVSSQGSIEVSAGATGTYVFRNCRVHGVGSALRADASSTQGMGSSSFTDCDVFGTSLISKGGNGTATMNAVSSRGQSTITLAGPRSGIYTRVAAENGGTIIKSGTGNQTDEMTECVASDGGVLAMQINGNDPSQFIRCTARAGGEITLTSPGTGVEVRACEAAGNGLIDISGTGNALFLECRASEFGIILANNNMASPSVGVRGCIVQAGVAIFQNLQNAYTGIGLLIHGRLDVVGPSTGSDEYEVGATGQLLQNGGNSTRIDKKLSGTLTTGNFNHANIYHWSPVNQTLTAPNAAQGRDLFNNTLV